MIEFIVHCMTKESEETALSATEFWRLLSEDYEVCEAVVGNHLDNILQALLTRYSLLYAFKVDFVEWFTPKMKFAGMPTETQIQAMDTR